MTLKDYRMRGAKLLLVLVMGCYVSGCATLSAYSPFKPSTPFAQGYRDGCNKKKGGSPSRTRFAKAYLQARYDTGWNEGYSICDVKDDQKSVFAPQPRLETKKEKQKREEKCERSRHRHCSR